MYITMVLTCFSISKPMRIDHINVIPECYVDTNLIQYLIQGTVNHQHGCNNVVGKIKNSFHDRFAIGIIDNDKDQVGYLKDCLKIAQTTHLQFFKHKTLPHYLITVDPATDQFILECANNLGVNPENFNLPSELQAFTKRTKKTSSNNDPDIRNLIRSIGDHAEIKALRQSLQYLIQKQYSADNDGLIRSMQIN